MTQCNLTRIYGRNDEWKAAATFCSQLQTKFGIQVHAIDGYEYHYGKGSKTYFKDKTGCKGFHRYAEKKWLCLDDSKLYKEKRSGYTSVDLIEAEETKAPSSPVTIEFKDENRVKYQMNFICTNIIFQILQTDIVISRAEGSFKSSKKRI